MNKILIIDDEESIASMIKLCLSKNGYLCDTAYSGNEASDLIEKNHYDLALLDIMLPDINGFELISYIHEFNIPVIYVSAKVTVSDKIKGLKLGAEDYITKPFDLDELLARVETVLRRYGKTQRIIKTADIEIDTFSRTVKRAKSEIVLTTKEFDLFLFLVRNSNIALYRETIFEQVWGEEYFGNTRTIDLHIQRLKKKLNLGEAIETIYKIGYKFSPEKIK